ncbi:hypothetical protein O0I10_002196 [Lichtheimia ornata]|uniref:Phospholipid/glycerol acyltransferase domain-containing protein n=1 Tax=Lichtheimia ornata TaxID=688661 RepID=A0AAD7Y2Q6_9FUNG|nr:uncharacterized protein O0I10_002196 [Lichtheimia ornata]KAJ8661867.1 hypothetical protein O0I10_002196 [Lichtheimia ornata]
MPFGLGHEFVILVSRSALWSFFVDIKLQDEHNIPTEGPMIVAATHHNMIVDPAVLSVTFPDHRRFHYWAKDSMFKHPLAKRFLENCGVVPVDRKTRNNAQLYAATYDVMRLGESVAVFPEGTSHTLPHLGTFKDGTSFAALEYAKVIEEDPHPNADGSLPRKAVILPVGIVYPEKSKYRSVAIVKYGKPLHVDPYMDTYYQDPKKAAKQLTADLRSAIEGLTVNAPDWESRDAAEMARWLLFPGENGSMRDYISVTQSLIGAFADLSTSDPDIALLEQSLRAYKMELEALSLKDSHIAKYNERDITAASTTMELLRRTMASMIDLPLFLPGLVGHLPLYVAGYYAGKFEIYEEVRAQNKIFLGLLMVPFVYILAFIWGWYTLFGGTFFGFFAALATLGVFVWYHVVSIDERYENFKDLVGRWRLFDAVVLGRGMWRRKDRILQLKQLRDSNLQGVRRMVKAYKGKNDHVHAVWLAIRSRVKQFGDPAKLHGRRKKLAKQFEWSFEE